MTDSNEERLEPGFKERVVTIGQPFSLFKKPMSTGPKTLLDTGQLKDIGSFSAIATSQLAENVESIQMNVLFEIEAPPAVPKQTPTEPIKGEPGQGLVLTAIGPGSKSRIWVSIARIDNEPEVRRIIFDQWFDVTGKDPRQTKEFLAITNRQSQPLTIPKGELNTTTFRFDRQSLLSWQT